MDVILAGKLALVTGGGRGIGAAIARALAKAGARVVVCGRNKIDLDAVAKEIGGIALRLDLTDRAQTDEVLASVGHVDVLVNNAGVAESAALDRTSDAIWDRIMELDATAPFRVVRALVPSMVAAKWGRVINVASNAGVSGYGYSTAYCAAKHAMVGMTRALAIDLARSGVTINALCPGWVETQMLDEAVTRIAAKTGRSETEARTSLASMSPQRRMITPEEVAYAALMLCSEGARGIHGQTIVIDGGAVLK
ncbi:MAG TPA: SDR family NAD(P)-dependent oxidoreductase [Kofleriaceae bacterium]|jgi:NAD(P)-dependent dehydrogenase (short-subunit alcohol dehydrogenase family)|nr:SDR family NAD(P)-dependent oxidoreductase [Kofleriaceae bacterium]